MFLLFVFMFCMCCLDVIPLSYVTPNVVGLLVRGISSSFRVTGGFRVCSRFHGVMSVSVNFVVETFSLIVWSHVSSVCMYSFRCVAAVSILGYN